MARFSHKLAIAPTASISIICGGTSAGIEPIPANIYTHKTLSGEDVVAVIEGTEGPVIDGRGYLEPDFVADLEGYHRRAVEAHKVVHERPPALPSLPEPIAAARRDSAAG